MDGALSLLLVLRAQSHIQGLTPSGGLGGVVTRRQTGLPSRDGRSQQGPPQGPAPAEAAQGEVLGEHGQAPKSRGLPTILEASDP